MTSSFDFFVVNIEGWREETKIEYSETNLLEEISTQNGPPKENNKIIIINFGGRKEKNYFFLFVFPTYFPMILLKF